MRHLDAEVLGVRLLEAPGRRRAADRDRPQRRDVVALFLAELLDRDPDGRHRASEGHLLGLDEPADVGRLDIRAGEDLVGAHHDRAVRQAPGVGVEHRHDVQDAVVLGKAEQVGRGLGEAVEEHRAVRVDDAFRMAGGAGGVAHAGGIGLGERWPFAHRLGARHERFVLGMLRRRLGRAGNAVGHDHDASHGRQRVPDPRDHGPEARVDEDGGVAGVIDDVGQVRRREADVEGM